MSASGINLPVIATRVQDVDWFASEDDVIAMVTKLRLAHATELAPTPAGTSSVTSVAQATDVLDADDAAPSSSPASVKILESKATNAPEEQQQRQKQGATQLLSPCADKRVALKPPKPPTP